MRKVYFVVVLMAVMPCLKTFAATIDSTAVDEPVKEKAFEAGVGVNLVSSYLWRGSQLDRAAIQTDASISWKGLCLDVWGSTGLVNELSVREVDFALSYSIAGFSVGVTDYYCPSTEADVFFGKGPHTIEVGVGYDFRGYVAVNWYTNVCFDDQYSSYLEISAPFSIGAIDFAAAVGCSPYKSEFYGTEGFNVINCSLTAGKEFEVGPITIPISAQLMANPAMKAMFFAASVGVSF